MANTYSVENSNELSYIIKIKKKILLSTEYRKEYYTVDIFIFLRIMHGILKLLVLHSIVT